MRDILIDLSTNNYPKSIRCGFDGEHNQTQLVVILPEDLVSSSVSYSYKFAFGTPYGEKILYPSTALLSDNKVKCILAQDVTVADCVAMQVEAYQNSNNQVNLIAKTPVVTLLIGKSVEGGLIDHTNINPETNLYEQIMESISALQEGKQDKTDDGLQTTAKTVVGAINEVKDDTTALFDNTFTLSRDKQDKTDEALILDDNLDGNVVLAIKNTRTRLDVVGSQLSNNKQNKTDNALQTTDKTVVGAINEVDSELSQLNSTVDDMGRQVGANSTAISDINGEVSELKEDLSDLSEIVHFPITSNPFTQENYFSKSTGIELHYTDDGFALSTSGINGIFCFNIGNLVVGNTYELSFNIPADDFYSVAIKGYSQSNVKGHFSYTFTADRGNESIQFSIWYTNNNFAVSNVKLKNLSEKPFLFEEIRAKEVETELQDQLDRKISKDDLTGVIKFAGEGINPFTQENYTYTGVNEFDITFTDFGFEIPVAGINDSGIWFNVPTVIGGRYRIQFSVKTGVFNSINIDNVAVVPIDNVISYEFTATKQTTSIRFVIWYTSPSYIVTDAKLVDLDEKTGILSSSWYKDKKGVRLGDSITAQAEFWTSGNLQGSGWSTLVKDYFSCAEIVNCGIGGSTIAGTSVTNAMWTDARIDAIPTDCDFVLFMGGTNDWSQNVPIGDIDSTDTDTFYGALNVISQKLTARLPNANIIWMCNVYGKDTNKPEKNTVNLTLYDYSRAFIASADRNGFAVIDTYKAWNKYNCEPYLNAEGDGTVFIHPNVAGGKKMANLIINGMKFYEPVIS